MANRIVPLGDVAEFIRGITFKPEDVTSIGATGSVVCLRTKNVQADVDLNDLWAVPEILVKRTEQFVRVGDILVSSANSWNLVGKCCRIPLLPWRATFGGFVSVLRPKHPDLSDGYLYHWFSSERIQATVRSFGQQTTNISNLNIQRCLKLPLPLPPVEEQRRIAMILDKADELRAKRRAARQRLEGLTHAIFMEMFGDPITNVKGFDVKPLGKLTTKIGSGATPLGGEAAYKAEGIALIRSMNVRDGLFRRKDLARIDEHQAAKLAIAKVEADDVLLNITGASVARVCRIPEDILPARVNQHVSIIRAGEALAPIFLERLLLFPSVKRKLLQLGDSGGATRQAITKAQIASLNVIVPSIPDQRRFVQRQEVIERLWRQQNQFAADADALFESIQDRAFGGEL